MCQGTNGTRKLLIALVPFLFFNSYIFCASGKIKSLRRLIRPTVRVLSSTELGKDFEKTLLLPLQKATGPIYGMYYTLSNKPVIATLLEKADSGISVELVVDASTVSTVRDHHRDFSKVASDEKGINQQVRKLIEHENIKLHVHAPERRGLMHCKTMIMCDVECGKDEYKDVVHGGSANCTGLGMDGTNCELSYLFTGSEMAQRHIEIFETVRDQSREIVFKKKRELCDGPPKKRRKVSHTTTSSANRKVSYATTASRRKGKHKKKYR